MSHLILLSVPYCGVLPQVGPGNKKPPIQPARGLIKPTGAGVRSGPLRSVFQHFLMPLTVNEPESLAAAAAEKNRYTIMCHTPWFMFMPFNMPGFHSKSVCRLSMAEMTAEASSHERFSDNWAELK
ncbi:hypothetical protein LJC47_02680 [Desulfosarcina sp. OttesenSCG-928-B08]|nr:hypothetical protein [Desulfosarcina sp. OttesenSCG-928-B08]